MNNLEKHQKELAKYLLNNESFCVTEEGNICSCRAHYWKSCGNCLFYSLPGGCTKARKDWLMEECVESKVDWSKVAVDTPILVRNFESDLWKHKYFAKYENGKIYAWADGRTSWSANESNDIIDWSFAKLIKE